MKGMSHNRYASEAQQEILTRRPWGADQLKPGLSNVLSNLQLQPNKVLDVGFGCCARSTVALAEVLPNARIVAIDNSVAALSAVVRGGGLTQNVCFCFGDPEFALPIMDDGCGLVVLSMVTHCFNYPYRALGNLITYALSGGGYVLFVHRTDQFMRAICGMPEEAEWGSAAKAVAQIWSTSAVKPDFHHRLICEHAESMGMFMKEAGFQEMTRHSEAFTSQKEYVSEVIRERRYAPLDLLSNAGNVDSAIINDEVELEFILYRRETTFGSLPHIASLVSGVPFYYCDVERGEIEPLLKDMAEEEEGSSVSGAIPLSRGIGRKAKRWFTEDTEIGDGVLKYGYYVDIRFSSTGSESPTSIIQLWPDGSIVQPTRGQSLIQTLTTRPKQEIAGRPFIALCWVYIPSASSWAESGYALMEGVVDMPKNKVDWHLLPYSDMDDAKDVVVREIERTLIDGAGPIPAQQVADDLWQHLKQLVGRLKDNEIEVTWYFLFRDTQSRQRQPIAFSVQATRWLGVDEVRRVGSVAQAGLAAINEAISSYHSLASDEYRRIKCNLDDITKAIAHLQGVTLNISRINEVINPDVVIPGTTVLEEFSQRLNDPGVVFADSIDKGHRPYQFADNNDLMRKLEGELGLVYSRLKKSLLSGGEGPRADRFKDVVEKLFVPFSRAEKAAIGDLGNGDFKRPLPAMCLAKSLREGIPYAWIVLALDPTLDVPAWCWRFRIGMRSERRVRLLRALHKMADQLHFRNVDIGAEMGNNEARIVTKVDCTYDSGYTKFAERVAPVVYGAESEQQLGTLRQSLRWLKEECDVCFSEVAADMPVTAGRIGIVSFSASEAVRFSFEVTGFETGRTDFGM